MKMIQHRYPFRKDANDRYCVKQGTMTDTRYTHIGIQIPYRPFISERKSPAHIDITINDKGYIVNLPCLLEFDDVNLRQVNISFYLDHDRDLQESDDLTEILREAIVDIGYEKIST